MHIAEIIQWIIILVLAAWLFMIMAVVGIIGNKVDRILQSGWFPEPREDLNDEV